LSSELFTVLVNCGARIKCRRNNVIRGTRRKVKPESGGEASVRATISFPGELYRTLEQIASQKKVSLAWVVREATEQYIENKWPLFKREI
jgi:hypothetical protein